jgi:hypothetical protein
MQQVSAELKWEMKAATMKEKKMERQKLVEKLKVTVKIPWDEGRSWSTTCSILNVANFEWQASDYVCLVTGMGVGRAGKFVSRLRTLGAKVTQVLAQEVFDLGMGSREK